MATRKAIRPKKSIPVDRRHRQNVPTLRVGLSLPSFLVTQVDLIARSFGVSRSYIISVLLTDTVLNTVQSLEDFKDQRDEVPEALARAIFGTVEDSSALPLCDRLELLREAADGRNT